MLIIQRRIGERIVIGGGIEIIIAAATRNGVRLAVRAPGGVTVLRGEVFDAIAESNALALATPATDPPPRRPL